MIYSDYYKNYRGPKLVRATLISTTPENRTNDIDITESIQNIYGPEYNWQGCLWTYKEVFGEKSYGKGSVQSIIPLKNKGAIRLTISKYFLPSGKSISEVGVVPDIEVTEETEDFKINTESDNQLKFALKLLDD